MKYRNGFVSNSSSGSFILHWRVKGFGEKISAKKAVCDIFCVELDEKTNEIDWENTWNHEDIVKNKIEDVLKHTVDNGDNTFISTFWTSMFNSSEDFGEAAKSLVMGIVADGKYNFEIIDTKVEDNS